MSKETIFKIHRGILQLNLKLITHRGTWLQRLWIYYLDFKVQGYPWLLPFFIKHRIWLRSGIFLNLSINFLKVNRKTCHTEPITLEPDFHFGDTGKDEDSVDNYSLFNNLCLTNEILFLSLDNRKRNLINPLIFKQVPKSNISLCTY